MSGRGWHDGASVVPVAGPKTEASRAYPGLDKDHRFLRTVAQNQMQRLRQHEEDEARNPRREKICVREFVKPANATIAIHRSPGVMKPPKAEPRGTLFLPAKSKWYADDDFTPSSFTPLHTTQHKNEESLEEKALQEFGCMRTDQVSKLIAAICLQAMNGGEETEAALNRCIIICQEQNGMAFLDGLLQRLGQFYEDREDFAEHVEGPEAVPRRWTFYVTFLARLLVGLDGHFGGAAHFTAAQHTQLLARLICCCCLYMLRPPSLGHPAEIQCLKMVLQLAGETISKQAHKHMKNVMNRIRVAYTSPGPSPTTNMMLAELMLLNASPSKISTREGSDTTA
ncbi:uncharacterized protein LOC144179937 [Haemaphysalis longicornis]